jgi:hypothetical protein
MLSGIALIFSSKTAASISCLPLYYPNPQLGTLVIISTSHLISLRSQFLVSRKDPSIKRSKHTKLTIISDTALFNAANTLLGLGWYALI